MQDLSPKQEKIFNIILLLSSIYAIYKQLFINSEMNFALLAFHVIVMWYAFFKLFIWQPNKEYKHLKPMFIILVGLIIYNIYRWFMNFL